MELLFSIIVFGFLYFIIILPLVLIVMEYTKNIFKDK